MKQKQGLFFVSFLSYPILAATIALRCRGAEWIERFLFVCYGPTKECRQL